jgi:hypothetical protein
MTSSCENKKRLENYKDLKKFFFNWIHNFNFIEFVPNFTLALYTKQRFE